MQLTYFMFWWEQKVPLLIYAAPFLLKEMPVIMVKYRTACLFCNLVQGMVFGCAVELGSSPPSSASWSRHAAPMLRYTLDFIRTPLQKMPVSLYPKFLQQTFQTVKKTKSDSSWHSQPLVRCWKALTTTSNPPFEEKNSVSCWISQKMGCFDSVWDNTFSSSLLFVLPCSVVYGSLQCRHFHPPPSSITSLTQHQSFFSFLLSCSTS